MTYYDEIAKGYEELHKEEQLNKIETAKTLIFPNPTDSLLDVGCGTGLTTTCWNCKTAGLDPSLKLIEIARQKNNKIEYRIETAENNSFSDEQFDFVISITAIQNFKDYEKSLLHMKRVLKPNGKILISTLKRGPNKDKIKQAVEKQFFVLKEKEDVIDIFWLCETRKK